jgi:hypothetical protein
VKSHQSSDLRKVAQVLSPGTQTRSPRGVIGISRPSGFCQCKESGPCDSRNPEKGSQPLISIRHVSDIKEGVEI